MFSSESADLNSVNTNPSDTDTGSRSDTTKLYLNEPIKILLFPPSNRQFRFDENTQRIEIEPVPQEGQFEGLVCGDTTLTPLVDSCCSICDSTPMKDSKNETKELHVREILKIKRVFQGSRLKENCFLKGCKWSGDGLCLLSNSEDNVLRLFEVSDAFNSNDDVEPVLEIKEGGIVYDYAWYPKMSSSDPVSCVFASTSQNSPIHLWDAYTGQLRATYQPINQYDEVTSAYSLAFTPDGTKIYSGFKKCLRIFDISLPGRVSDERNLRNKGNPFQSNIISSVCVNPVIPSLYALGSYDKTVGIYAEPVGELLCILKGHSGGITQVMFSANGNYLFSGARKDDEILCWDIRNPGKVVFSVERKVRTQQKILFDLAPDQDLLITGTTDCDIKIFNVKTENENVLKPLTCYRGHDDCVNAVQFHPNMSVFASSSGQRHLPEASDGEEDCGIPNKCFIVDNSIKVWSFSHSSIVT